MAAALSPSSPNGDSHTPQPSASRRLPPPCWSPDETVALIDAYRDKWYSLRRGNLKATHWQEVADDVAARCPSALPKTPIQCRHKMEKLRKRYRSEIQRAALRRSPSPWPHFHSMNSMEKGPNPAPSSDDDDQEDDNLYNYNQRGGAYGGQLNVNNGAGSGFRIRIPGRATAGPTVAKVYSKFDEMGGPSPVSHNPRFLNYAAGVNGAAASSKISRDSFLRERGDDDMPRKSKGGDGLSELAAAIHGLGEGYVRMEKAKMDMVQQIEEMRMEMELKRTEMLLESEQRIVEAFAQGRSFKRAKRNSTTPD